MFHIQPLDSASVSETNGNGGAAGYLLFVWSPAGYTLREEQGDLPAVGHSFESDGRQLVVNKIGASPLPGDARPCVFSIGAA
jgi:hypothetical protein